MLHLGGIHGSMRQHNTVPSEPRDLICNLYSIVNVHLFTCIWTFKLYAGSVNGNCRGGR